MINIYRRRAKQFLSGNLRCYLRFAMLITAYHFSVTEFALSCYAVHVNETVPDCTPMMPDVGVRERSGSHYDIGTTLHQ